MDYSKLRKLYKKQKERVDELYNELDDMINNIDGKEKSAKSLLYSEMRALSDKWNQYYEAVIALDNIMNVEFDIEDEEE